MDMKSSEIMEALIEPAMNIIKGIREVLEKTPPELIGDIYTDGITLTGGLSQLGGFADLISMQTKLNIKVAESPADCVVKGSGMAIEYVAAAENNTLSSVNPLLAAY